jgi:hypothetical protein
MHALYAFFSANFRKSAGTLGWYVKGRVWDTDGICEDEE